MFSNSLDSFESIQSFDPDFKTCQSITIDPITKAPKFSIKNEKKLSEFTNQLGEHREDLSNAKDPSSEENSDLVAIEYYTQVSQTIKSWLVEYGISNINSFPLVKSKSQNSSFIPKS